MEIKRIVGGMQDWNVIFELENGLYAMSNVSVKEPVQFSMTPNTFLRHGYFVSADQLNDATIVRAKAVLQHYLNDGESLKDCPMLGSRQMICRLLGLDR